MSIASSIKKINEDGFLIDGEYIVISRDVEIKLQNIFLKNYNMPFLAQREFLRDLNIYDCNSYCFNLNNFNTEESATLFVFPFVKNNHFYVFNSKREVAFKKEFYDEDSKKEAETEMYDFLHKRHREACWRWMVFDDKPNIIKEKNEKNYN